MRLELPAYRVRRAYRVHPERRARQEPQEQRVQQVALARVDNKAALETLARPAVQPLGPPEMETVRPRVAKRTVREKPATPTQASYLPPPTRYEEGHVADVAKLVQETKPVSGKRPYNNIVRTGMWITVAAALVWVGGETYKQIQTYVPWVLALGIALLVLGLLVQFRKSRPPE